MRLAAEAYRLGKLLPKAEEYRLTSQLPRAAASVPADIAEGLVDVKLLANEQIRPALELCSEIGRMLNGLLARLRGNPET